MFHDDGSVGRQSRGRVLDGVVPALGLGRRIKRIFDIAVAATSLVLLSPIILVVSVAIKFDSDGPVFSGETLYGYKNRAFRALKFRSVKTCAETDRDDWQVTRVGRGLRRTGIDELPRLLNVVSGEISIVGPLPYARRQDLFENRLMPLLDGVKPGLTGWAQIVEAREGFRTTEQRINDDLHYVENWSLFLDIKIILMMLVP